MNALKILIADGSPVYRKMFRQAAAETCENADASFAGNGREALEAIKRADYDIIVIDAEISGPGADGLLGLLAEAMKKTPDALVLIAARPSLSNERIFGGALDKGAAGCLTKPIYNSYAENIDEIKRKLNSLKALRGKDPETGGARKPKPAGKNRFKPEIILIASSTGGPLALENILSRISGDLPVPVLIVQHMPANFVETLAHNLDRKARLQVKVAQNRETVKAGTVYIAPGGLHMKLDGKNRIYFDDSDPVNGVRPAADILFESVAESFGGTGVLTVILTGMGYDGEKGLAKLKEKRECFCIAQSEETCVVYGMPRAAAESGLADRILDLDKIPSEIESFRF